MITNISSNDIFQISKSLKIISITLIIFGSLILITNIKKVFYLKKISNQNKID